MDRTADAAPCGIVVLATDGTILEVNTTFASWVDPDTAVGVPLKNLLDAGSRLFFETRFLPMLQLGERPPAGAMTLSGLAGHRRPVLIEGAPQANGVPGYVLAIFDMTHRAEYDRKLLDAQRSAESLDRRITLFRSAASAFGSANTEEDLCQALVEIAGHVFDTPEVGAFLQGADDEFTLVAGVNPLEGLIRGRGPQLGRRSLAEGAVIAVGDLAAADELSPELGDAFRMAGIDALTVAPIFDEHDALGVLVCFYRRPLFLEPQDDELQETLGRQSAQALLRIRLQERERRTAMHDPLTGLPNRQLFEERLDSDLNAAIEAGTTLAVVFADLDGFKVINDELGHRAGDAVLSEVGRRLRRILREEDQLARYGGDEFLATCEVEDPDAALAVAGRLLAAIREPLPAPAEGRQVSASMGVVVCRPADGSPPSMQSLIARADAAMYESKNSGKDSITLVRA